MRFFVNNMHWSALVHKRMRYKLEQELQDIYQEQYLTQSNSIQSMC